MKKDSKQRLFEMMGKLDSSFNNKLNENEENFNNDSLHENHQFKDNLDVKVHLPDDIYSSDIYINNKSLLDTILNNIGHLDAIGVGGSLDNYFNFLKKRDGGFSEEKLANNRLFRVNIQHAWDLYNNEEF